MRYLIHNLDNDCVYRHESLEGGLFTYELCCFFGDNTVFVDLEDPDMNSYYGYLFYNELVQSPEIKEHISINHPCHNRVSDWVKSINMKMSTPNNS